MAAVDKILSQRARLAFWSPLLCAVILAGILYTPFASLDNSITGYIDEDEDRNFQQDFYLTYFEVTASSEDVFGEENADRFGGEYNQRSEYNSNTLFGDEMDEMDDLVVSLESKAGWLTYLVVFLLILQVVRIQGEWTGSGKFNAKSVVGVTLAVAGIIAFSAFFAIFSGLEDAFEYVEEDFDDSESGLYGSASTEYDDGDESITEEEKWGPSFSFWLMLVFALFALGGAAANLSFLKDDLQLEDEPIWGKSDNPPDFIAKHTPMLGVGLLTLAVVAVIVSIFTPWYSIEQSWEVERLYFDGDNGTYNNTTHEVSWKLSPFMVSFTNDSGIELVEEGEVTSSSDSYSTHHELENMAPVLMQLRWPLVCAGLLGLFFLAREYSSKVSDMIGGTREGWALVVMLGLLIVMVIGTGSFHSDMVRYAEDDLQSLSPSRNISINGNFAEDSFSGKAITIEYDFDWLNNYEAQYYIQHQWGGGIGYFAASLVPWLIITGMAINHGPKFVEDLNEENSPFKFDFDRAAWSPRPVIATLIAILLLSTLGSGMGELVIDSTDEAPPGLYAWDIFVDNSWSSDGENKIMEDGETWQIVHDTEVQSPGNVTEVSILIRCDENVQGFLTDNLDSVDWSIVPPAGVDATGLTLSGSINCNSTWNEVMNFEGDYFIPEDGVFAESRKAVENMIVWTNTGEGAWTIIIDANVEGGSTPGSNDPDLDAMYSVSVEYIDEIVITKEDN
jgi:hypothetical protein